MIISKLLLTIALVSLGIVTTFKAQPVIAAERISFSLPIWGEFYVSVDDLEIFAEEGRITSEFAYYTNRLDKETLQQLRQILQASFKVDPVTVYRVTNMPMGEDFLKRLGEIVYTHPERNGLYAIRSALILAAAEPEGLTVINFLRHFPTGEMQLNTDAIFSLFKEAENFVQYKDTTVEAIAQQAETEIASQKQPNFENLPDLRQLGKYAVIRETVTFPVNDLRQTPVGFLGDYELNVDIYSPQALERSAPLVVIAHGLGSERSDFRYLAEHLASYGYLVAIPEHSGSSGSYKEAYLRGEVSIDVSPVEFYSRPRDITHLLNQLEQHPIFKGQIDWLQVGVLGHSFGGTTVLSIAGASLNWERINRVCQQAQFSLNVSTFLQCRASTLPPGNYNFQDPRVKAVVAVNPVTSSILGPESMGQINIPALIVGGTQDFVSPFIEEQVHPFVWLNTPDKYLATVVGGSHLSNVSQENLAEVADFLKGSRPDLGKSYFKALSLAFFEVYVRDRSDYQPYLTAAYAQKISDPELPLHLIQSLTSKQLEQAYGDTPPTPIVPETIVAKSDQPKRDILAEIEQTGRLKVAMRTNAAPFSYKNQNNGWAGYCSDLADSLGRHLTQKLEQASAIKVAKVASSLSTRFELVEQETVHLECGPNSIVTSKEGIIFSDPFFSSGTRFFVTNTNISNLDFSSQLPGVKLGVLQHSITEQFLQQNYPDAEIVAFDEVTGRRQGIQAVADGKIDTFASDSVLITGEMNRQRISEENYQIVPKTPLTCDYYGLILPQGDPQWRNTVNTFIREQQAKKVFDKWLTNYYPQAVADLDYCQNRREQSSTRKY